MTVPQTVKLARHAGDLDDNGHDAVIPAFATPAVVLGTAAAAGAASTTIRSDATIVAFDATVPTTQALGDAAATGSVAKAARRDHKHAMPALSSATPLVESGAGAVGTGLPSSREDHVHPVAAGGGGTVTSVALTVPAEFAVAGSPITTTGTLAVTKANQPANQVWAGPTTGSAAAPAFRALVAADIPGGAGYHEVVMVTSSSPPDPVLDSAGTDWCYSS